MKFNTLYEFIMSEDANRDFWPPVHDDYAHPQLDRGVAGDPELDHAPAFPSLDGQDDMGYASDEDLEADDYDYDDEDYDELDEKKVKRTVVRGGVKKKLVTSDKKGFKILGGREVKMDQKEMKARAKGGKRAHKKVKHQKATILKKRALSMKRKKSI